MKPGAAYIRVSTEEQAEFSPDAQLRAIKDYAEKHEILLPDEYIFSDEGISGRKADKRPAFMKMISTAKRNPRPFDVILVHKFDRFSRNREDSVVFKSLLRKDCGIQVVSITEKIEDDKFSVILEAMLEAMAEYYSLNLSEEVMKGMTEKARTGGILTKAPYGYKNLGAGLTPITVPDEAAVVKMMFQKITTGDMSPYTLARYLNSRGIPTARGRSWSVFSVKYLLTNPFYTGLSVWNKKQRSTGQYKNESDWITAQGRHEPIINNDIFNAVQDILNISKQRCSKPPSQQGHWLNGLLKCSSCGSNLSAHSKSEYPFFQCNGYNKGKCNVSHYAAVDVIENTVFDALTSFIQNPNQDIAYKEKRKLENADVDNLSFLYESLKKANKKLSRIKRAFENGIDTLEEYSERKKKLLDEIEELNKEINIPWQSHSKEDFRFTPQCLSDILQALHSPDISVGGKNIMLKSIIEKIVFNKQNKTLELYFSVNIDG